MRLVHLAGRRISRHALNWYRWYTHLTRCIWSRPDEQRWRLLLLTYRRVAERCRDCGLVRVSYISYG